MFYTVTSAMCRNLSLSIVVSLGVNFINVLRAAFTLEDPKSSKQLLDLMVFFALLGSVGVKAARRMLMKLTLVLALLQT